jgi:hypothetical protein
MAQGLGVKAMARLAGVSPAAVRKARAAGYLLADAEGRFDPALPGNRFWLQGRLQGVDGLGRLLPARRRAAALRVDLVDLDISAMIKELS